MQNLLGFLLPPVIAAVNSKVTNPTLRFIASLGISAIVAVIVHFQELQFMTPEQIFASIGLIATEAQIAYRTYWHEESPVRQMIGK